MKKNRKISKVIYGEMMDMGGFPVRQPLPSAGLDQLDPFILLHHADVRVPANVEPRHAGVGPHPHRGFSPVTFIFKGGVHHRDSRGNDSVIYEGGTQWMNAGRGIIHSERPPDDIASRGSRQEIIQLWVNTPSAYKMDEPKYLPLTKEGTPELTSDDKKITVNVIAGSMLEISGAIPTLTPINALTIYAKAGGKYYFPLPARHNTLLYILEGKLRFDDEKTVEEKNLVAFANDGEGVSLEALTDSRALLVSGEPIDEPMVSHGPFVMNTDTQILEAMRDYRMGKMGVLIEE